MGLKPRCAETRKKKRGKKKKKKRKKKRKKEGKKRSQLSYKARFSTSGAPAASNIRVSDLN
jgi:hypothetical protein